MTAWRRKICRTCKVEKPINQFYCHPTYADGRMNDCKECKRTYQRELHWLKRETVLARKRIYNATPAQRAARAAYARSERGKAIMAESKKAYRLLRKMDRQAVAA